MLEFWRTFSTHFVWGVQFLFIPQTALVTAAIYINFGAALWHYRRYSRDFWKPTFRWICLQVVCWPIIVGIGVLGAYQGTLLDPAVPRVAPLAWAVWSREGFQWLSLALGLFFVYRMKGLRWLAISFLLVVQWLILGASFIAGMSISGDWI